MNQCIYVFVNLKAQGYAFEGISDKSPVTGRKLILLCISTFPGLQAVFSLTVESNLDIVVRNQSWLSGFFCYHSQVSTVAWKNIITARTVCCRFWNIKTVKKMFFITDSSEL